MVSGQYGPLGWTQGNGACKPESVVNEFFGTGQAPQYQGGRASTGAEDDLSGLAKLQSQRREEHKQYVRQVSGGFWNLPVVGTLGLGGKRTEYPTENIVQTMAGQGKDKGLPTADDNGEVSVIYRQVCATHCSKHQDSFQLTMSIFNRLTKTVPVLSPQRSIPRQAAQTTRPSRAPR
jgi:hypothetical protein